MTLYIPVPNMVIIWVHVNMVTLLNLVGYGGQIGGSMGSKGENFSHLLMHVNLSMDVVIKSEHA